jgi:hypothetical protein
VYVGEEVFLPKIQPNGTTDAVIFKPEWGWKKDYGCAHEILSIRLPTKKVSIPFQRELSRVRPEWVGHAKDVYDTSTPLFDTTNDRQLGFAAMLQLTTLEYTVGRPHFSITKRTKKAQGRQYTYPAAAVKHALAVVVEVRRLLQ